jgi:acyl-CoA reductase-like NAD-dependent aldehyde dehydrogenase
VITSKTATRKEKIAREMTREMGKVLDETRGDVQEAIDMTYLMAGEGRRLHGRPRRPSCATSSTCACACPRRRGLITPWNFPIAIPSWKIMPALVCGNTVVIKPASLTPLSASCSSRLLRRRGAEGRRQRRHRRRREVGEPMLSSIPTCGDLVHRLDRSRARIVIACAPTFKHVHLEMGGKNVIMVMDDADLDLAVDGALWGAFGTAGQRCTASSRVVVHKEGVRRSSSRSSSARAKSLRVGNGLDPRRHGPEHLRRPARDG